MRVLSYAPGPLQTDMYDQICSTCGNQEIAEMFKTSKEQVSKGIFLFSLMLCSQGNKKCFLECKVWVKLIQISTWLSLNFESPVVVIFTHVINLLLCELKIIPTIDQVHLKHQGPLKHTQLQQVLRMDHFTSQ